MINSSKTCGTPVQVDYQNWQASSLEQNQIMSDQEIELINKNQSFELWTLTALVEFDIEEEVQTVWRLDELCSGTLRQCMDHAATLVPKYQGWGLTLNSIAEAWDDIFCQNLSYSWLDKKSEYFYVERID